MKESKEAKALAKLEKELTSVLEGEYKFYKDYIKRDGVNPEFDKIRKGILKDEIKKKYDSFTEELGLKFNVTEKSVGELQEAIDALEEDINKNGGSKEKRTLLNASKSLRDYIVRIDPKLDELCDDFYIRAKREDKFKINDGAFSYGFDGTGVGGVIGVAVGTIIVIAAVMLPLSAMIGTIGIGAFMLASAISLCVGGGIFGIVGLACGSGVGRQLDIREAKNNQEKYHIEDIIEFAQSIRKSANNLKMLTDIRQENIKLEGVSVAESGTKETAREQLEKSTKPNQNNMKK